MLSGESILEYEQTCLYCKIVMMNQSDHCNTCGFKSIRVCRCGLAGAFDRADKLKISF